LFSGKNFLALALSLSHLIDIHAKSRLVWSAAGEMLPASFRQLYQIIGAHDLLLQRATTLHRVKQAQPSLSLSLSVLCTHSLRWKRALRARSHQDLRHYLSSCTSIITCKFESGHTEIKSNSMHEKCQICVRQTRNRTLNFFIACVFDIYQP
jgi:hypothetical protein